MNDDELRRNADFLSIAMEEMDPDSVEYEFVEEVFENLLDGIEE